MYVTLFERFLSGIELIDLIQCLALGFISLKLLNFMTGNDNKLDYFGIFLIGFIFNLSTNFILITYFKSKPNFALNFIIILCYTYVVGLFITTGLAEKVLRKIGIRYSFNNNVWDDVYDNHSIKVKIGIKNIDVIYFGQLEYIENGKSNPKITISNFATFRYNDYLLENPIISYLSNPEKQAIFDTSKIDFVELYYNPQGNKATVDCPSKKKHTFSNIVNQLKKRRQND